MKEKKCLNCGSTELSRQATKYCSNKCQLDYQHKTYIEKWKKGLEDGMRGKFSISTIIRQYLFKKFNNKCSKCNWGEVNPYSGEIPLEVEHKDGNYRNNKEENLDLLCPNCHSLTPTYRRLNKNGRKGRK